VRPSSRRTWPLIAAALAGLLPLAAVPAARLAAPLKVIRECAAKVPGEVSGIKNLDAACPGLEDAILALKVDRMLYDGWREQLDRNSLNDVATLAEPYDESKPTGGPDAAALPDILKSMAREQAPVAKSWWEAFKAWLNTWFQSHDPDSLSWLDRWLEGLRQSAGLLSVVLYSLIGLVVIAAGWLVFNELKAAGLMGRGRGRPAPVNSPGAAPSDAANLNSEPIALAERVAALLRLLVSRLMQTGRLKSERSLTHRELVTLSVFDSEMQRAVFAAVAGSAESILYGAHSVPAERLDSVLRDGQVLLSQLPDSASPR
jgi:hypothetical protein